MYSGSDGLRQILQKWGHLGTWMSKGQSWNPEESSWGQGLQGFVGFFVGGGGRAVWEVPNTVLRTQEVKDDY